MRRFALILGLLLELLGRASARSPRSSVSKLLTLKRAPIVGAEANGVRDTNESQVVSLAGRKGVVRALFKPAAGASATRWVENVAPETYHRREVAVARVASLFGVAVPATVSRTIAGREGSLMVMVENAETLDRAASTGAHFDRARGERLTVFDYVVGNSDRKDTNAMVKKRSVPITRKVPIAIDNGQSLPTGPLQWFKVPSAWIQDHDGPLLPQTHAMLAKVDARRFARALVKSGIEKEAIVHALRRLEGVRTHPEIFERPVGSGLAGAQAMEERLRVFGKSETQDLSPQVLGDIDRIVEGAWAERPKALDTLTSFSRYYATESVHLGAVIDHSSNWARHDEWAHQVGTPAAADELVRKINLQVDRLAGDRTQLAKYYSQFAVRQLRQGTPFGTESRELRSPQPHFEWALHAPIDAIKSEMAVRVRAIAQAWSATAN